MFGKLNNLSYISNNTKQIRWQTLNNATGVTNQKTQINSVNVNQTKVDCSTNVNNATKKQI
jgi:hypothetical protein